MNAFVQEEESKTSLYGPAATDAVAHEGGVHGATATSTLSPEELAHAEELKKAEAKLSSNIGDALEKAQTLIHQLKAQGKPISPEAEMILNANPQDLANNPALINTLADVKKEVETDEEMRKVQSGIGLLAGIGVLGGMMRGGHTMERMLDPLVANEMFGKKLSPDALKEISAISFAAKEGWGKDKDMLNMLAISEAASLSHNLAANLVDRDRAQKQDAGQSLPPLPAMG